MSYQTLPQNGSSESSENEIVPALLNAGVELHHQGIKNARSSNHEHNPIGEMYYPDSPTIGVRLDEPTAEDIHVPVIELTKYQKIFRTACMTFICLSAFMLPVVVILEIMDMMGHGQKIDKNTESEIKDTLRFGVYKVDDHEDVKEIVDCFPYEAILFTIYALTIMFMILFGLLWMLHTNWLCNRIGISRHAFNLKQEMEALENTLNLAITHRDNNESNVQKNPNKLAPFVGNQVAPLKGVNMSSDSELSTSYNSHPNRHASQLMSQSKPNQNT